MPFARPPVRRPSHSRAGFTLVELLVVIVVIAILIGLLVPAVLNGVQSAREAQVVAEMSSFDAAMVNFKSKYGVDVPSFIVLYEDASQWDPANPAAAVADVSHRESRAFLRQCWPDFDFTYANGTTNGAATPGFMDINGNGEGDDVLILNGAECLVFFLGGICETDVVGNDVNSTVKSGASAGDTATWWNPLGFSANPQNPFARGGNRVDPFAKFDAGQNGRIRNFFSVAFDPKEDMPEYFDTLPGQLRPLLYVSSYGGRGYRPSGPDGINATADDELPRPPPAGTESQGMGDIYYSDSSLTTPQNPNSYQLISPGVDFEYGLGGEYNGSSATARPADRDNITNFKNGRLN